MGACGRDVIPVQPTEWHSEAGYRWRDLAVPERGSSGFRSLPPDRTGISFGNVLTEEGLVEKGLVSAQWKNSLRNWPPRTWRLSNVEVSSEQD